MPSGGNTALDSEDMQAVWADYEAALKNGLVYEWLQYFIGGVAIDKFPVPEASLAARVEWDF